ncbi:irregular chiasm C-roughest protein [Tetranychus urticae]|uniref:irregular chiasm C-roughest protein n=1 Tax=Tetranychus urticae TaxID=32264 RepID=UPI00077BBF3A|nr:irregular chiasm C-roughest protein [Tetranychus urticae]XP_015795129.1 irregular chiasm C-roughest protein [Tetranychus urticae]XP_025018461.1 irregular chiasm C-roughest protein [Tetranychus urticae]XP_025018462.1 irregular chiasm C-roughest protein [Tetranychus urticae]
MEFVYILNLIILLLGTLIVSSFEPVTAIALANGAGETPTSDRLSDRKRSRNNAALAAISDQPISKEESGTPGRTRGEAKIKQKFAIEPMDKSAIIGDTVLLPCRVLHKVGPLQWTRDGFGLGPDRKLEGFARYEMIGSDEEGDFSLQIKSVSLEDDATYQCQVGAADGVGGIRSRDAALIVFVPPEPPKIVQGDFLRTTAGVTVELTCESHGGKPAAELTWLDGDGNPVTSGITHTNQFLSDGKRANSALKWTFIPGREHHGKEFTCRAENPALNQPQKAHIRVEVKYKPEIQLTSDKISYMEGDDVRLSCKALANPPDIIFKWYRNGEVVTSDYSNNLVIPRVTRDMNGFPFTCEASNSVGTSKETYTLNIHYGPVFRSSLENVYAAVEGENVKLKCEPLGNPKPEIMWLYNGSSKVLSTNSELVIPSMSEDKAGRYVCRASVQGFPEVSSSTHVFIKGPPKIMSPSIQYAVDDETVKVECIVHSVPLQSKVTWIHNSQTIDIDNDQDFEVIEENKPSESITRNVLIIHKVKEENFGDYNCSVWNEYGQDYMIIRLEKHKSFPMLIIVATIIGSIVAVVSVTIIVILCMKRKSNLDGDDYLSDVKKESNTSKIGSSLTNSSKTLTNGSTSLTSNGTLTKHHQQQQGLTHLGLSPSQQQQHLHNLHLHQLTQQSQHALHHHVVDTGSSGADSDLKVEIRTASSLSERGHWDDLNEPPSVDPTITANQIQQVVDNIYNYTAQPLYSPSKDSSNNNGYIPSYVDYNREYLPPPPLTQEESQQQEAQHHHLLHQQQQQQQPSPGSLMSVSQQQQPQYQNHHQIQQQQQLAAAAAAVAAQGQLYSSGALLNNRDSYIDPNYGSLTLDSRYRSSSYLTSPNSYLRTTSNTPGSNNLATLTPKSSQPSPSALSSIYGTSQRYITSPSSNQVKQGTLATHV